MKVRCDFVTNSSSSSFIIAVHKDTDLTNEIKKFVNKNYNIIESEFKHPYSYYVKNGYTPEKLRDIAINYLEDELTSPNLTLGDWKIFSGVAENQSDYGSYFLYSSRDYDGEYFKKVSQYE